MVDISTSSWDFLEGFPFKPAAHYVYIVGAGSMQVAGVGWVFIGI